MPNTGSASIGIPLAYETTANHLPRSPGFCDIPVETDSAIGEFPNSTLSVLCGLIEEFLRVGACAATAVVYEYRGVAGEHIVRVDVCDGEVEHGSWLDQW
jgi:hypothetical protein